MVSQKCTVFIGPPCTFIFIASLQPDLKVSFAAAAAADYYYYYYY